jgi:hypothetical protein
MPYRHAMPACHAGMPCRYAIPLWHAGMAYRYGMRISNMYLHACLMAHAGMTVYTDSSTVVCGLIVNGIGNVCY